MLRENGDKISRLRAGDVENAWRRKKALESNDKAQ